MLVAVRVRRDARPAAPTRERRVIMSRLSRLFVIIALSAAAVFGPRVLPVGAATAAAAIDPNEVGGFIEDFGNSALVTLSDEGKSKAERVAEFRRLLNEGFDLEWIGRFVLGRYWRRATPEQRDEFSKLFQDYVVNTYASRFAEHALEPYAQRARNNDAEPVFKVDGQRPDGDDMVLVSGSMWRPDGPRVPLEFRVRTDLAQPKIIDITIEGVSMAITQRSEFGAVINRSGIDGLIEELRNRSMTPETTIPNGDDAATPQG